MEKKDFIEKYGFDLEDLKVGCIDNLMSKRFICCSIKELAYKIASDIYEALKVNNIDFYIMYKLVKTKYGYVHKIAFQYEDLYFIFHISWRGSALSIDDYEVVKEEVFETFKDWEDIEVAIEDDLED